MRHSLIAHHHCAMFEPIVNATYFIIISFNLCNKLMKLIPLVSQFSEMETPVNNCLKSHNSGVISLDLNPGLSMSKIAGET